jgi:hypothetical protein
VHICICWSAVSKVAAECEADVATEMRDRAAMVAEFVFRRHQATLKANEVRALLSSVKPSSTVRACECVCLVFLLNNDIARMCLFTFIFLWCN